MEEDAFRWMKSFPEERDENTGIGSVGVGCKRVNARRVARAPKKRRVKIIPFGMKAGDQSFDVPGIKNLTEEQDLPREDGYLWTAEERINRVPNLPFSPSWQEEMDARTKILENNVDMRFVRFISGNMSKEPWELYEETGMREVALRMLKRQHIQRQEIDRSIVDIKEKKEQIQALEKMIRDNDIKINEAQRALRTTTYTRVGDEFMSDDKFYFLVNLLEEQQLAHRSSLMISSTTEFSSAYVENRATHKNLKEFLEMRFDTKPHKERDSDNKQLEYEEILRRDYTMYAWSLFFRDQLDNRHLEVSTQNGSAMFLQETMLFVVSVALFETPPDLGLTGDKIPEKWWKDLSTMLESDTTESRKSNDMAKTDSEHGKWLKKWFDSPLYYRRRGTAPRLNQSELEITIQDFLWEGLAGTETINLKNLLNFVNAGGLSVLVNLAKRGCAFIKPEWNRAYCENLMGKVDPVEGILPGREIDAPPIAVDKLWRLSLAGTINAKVAVLMSHLVWRLFKKTWAWGIIELVESLLPAAQPTPNRFANKLNEYVAHLSVDEIPYTRRWLSATKLPLLRRGASIPALKRCISVSLACMSTYFSSVYTDLFYTGNVDFSREVVSALAGAVSPGHGLRILNDLTNGPTLLESIKNPEFRDFVLANIEIHSLENEQMHIRSYPIGMSQHLFAELGAYLRKMDLNLSGQNSSFKRDLEDARSAVARMAAEKQAVEPAPKDYIPSKEWTLSPEMRGRIVLKDIVVVSIIDSLDKLKRYVHKLKHMELEEIQKEVSLANSFAALVAAVVAEKQLLYPHQFTQTIQHLHVPLTVNEAVQKLKHYTYCQDGKLSLKSTGRRGNWPVGLWD